MALPTLFATNDNAAIDPERSMMATGFANGAAPSATRSKHPLESVQVNYESRMDQMHMSVLRKTQGIAAPLKIQMERRAAAQVGRHRFLPSSNLMLEVLQGKDGDIGLEDMFVDRILDPEVAATPHQIMNNLK